MIRERHNVVRHMGDPPDASSNPATHNTVSSSKFHNRGKFFRRALPSVECASLPLTLSETLSRFAGQLRILSTLAWGVSCLGTYRGGRNPHAKPSDRMVGTPTQWSRPSWPTSPTRFGLRTLRLNSQRFVAAAFAPLSAISADNENGRVSRSRSSLPRLCVVTRCETSRSFPNGSHRPF